MYKLYINGEFKDASEKQKIINPATGEVIAEAAMASAKDAESAIQAARDAFDGSTALTINPERSRRVDNGPWPKLSFDQRKVFILKIAQGILDKAGELAKSETLNNGKPIKESTFMDIPSAAKTFEHFANNFAAYLQGEKIDLSAQNAESEILREPLGVAVLIIPWNYPLLIASWKLAQALAAGNTVVLKPSSLTPLTALELAKIIHEAGLPKGVVNIINGSGAKIGEPLCADKRVDLISFTGSNEVGKQIINYSSKYTKKLIMELGGKSASIILKDADLEAAVNGSLCSIFLNQGQMCTAMSRIFVEDGIYDKFIRDFVDKAKRIKLGPGTDYETQMGPLVSKEQRDKVLNFIGKAKKEGAKLVCGGKIPEGNSLKNGFFLEPTVLTDVTPDMDIFKEEVFGPVACISKFSTPDEAVELTNASDFALAACVWTQNRVTAENLGNKINAGTVWINTYGMFYDEVPYGGFKQSGFGKELGKEGFLEYTRLKSLVIDKTKDSKPLVNYWYGF